MVLGGGCNILDYREMKYLLQIFQSQQFTEQKWDQKKHCHTFRKMFFAKKLKMTAFMGTFGGLIAIIFSLRHQLLLVTLFE